MAPGNVSHLFLQVKYQDKDVIVREGAEANTFYIILKGEVLLFDVTQYLLWTLSSTALCFSSGSGD